MRLPPRLPVEAPCEQLEPPCEYPYRLVTPARLVCGCPPLLGVRVPVPPAGVAVAPVLGRGGVRVPVGRGAVGVRSGGSGAGVGCPVVLRTVAVVPVREVGAARCGVGGVVTCLLTEPSRKGPSSEGPFALPLQVEPGGHVPDGQVGSWPDVPDDVPPASMRHRGVRLDFHDQFQPHP